MDQELGVRRFSTIPPAMASARHLCRYVLRPGGKDAPAFTISVFDTALPTGDGGTWIGFRLYQRDPGGPRKGEVIFESHMHPPTGSKDPADIVRSIVDHVAVGPGDLNPDPTEQYNPRQLEFASKWGRKLRDAAAQRFGWSKDELTKLRADIDVVYNRRQDLKAHTRHHFKAGVVEVKAKSKKEAKDRFRRALTNQLSTLPQFRVGATTGHVYSMYPHGETMVIQTVRPQHPQAPLGDSMNFPAQGLDDSKRVFEIVTKGLEAPPEPKTMQVPSIPPRATFDHPIPKVVARRPITRTLPPSVISGGASGPVASE